MGVYPMKQRAARSGQRVGEKAEMRMRLSLPAARHPLPAGREVVRMSPQRKIVLGVMTWLVVITAAHMAMNVDWKVMLNDRLPENERKLNVAYIPVT